MSHGISPLAAFHRTGDRSRLAAAPAEAQPALFAGYRDLAALRGDFPLLLGAPGADGPWLRSLADAVDAALADSAPPGPAGEPLRRQALAVEQAVRRQSVVKPDVELGPAWTAAREELGLSGPDTPLRAFSETLPAAARLLAYGPETAPLILERAWTEAERDKARLLGRRIRRLAQRLGDILLADRARSAEARQAGALERAVGRADRSVFDFEAMARLLGRAPAAPPLPEARRERIRAAIAVLEQQRLVGDHAWAFRFDDCAAAMAAWRQRLPAVCDLVRAIAVAELELENRYAEEQHDRLFETFDERRLGPGDFEGLPGYLLVLRDPDRAERDRALALLEAGYPVKIIVQVTDLFAFSLSENAVTGLGRQAQNLARMAVGLDAVFVLQCTDAFLYRLRDSALRGMSSSAPALFSVYSGADYLAAAAAAESRAFPSFVFDPQAAGGQPRRHSLAGNPQPAVDWPEHELRFENSGHQRQAEAVRFTFADFLACDPRFQAHFVLLDERETDIPDNELVPLADYLERDGRGRRHALPCVPLVDAHGGLHRAVVDERLVEATARCREAWRSLKDLCGSGAARVAEPAPAPAAAAADAAARAAASPTPEPPTPAPAPAQPASAQPAPEAAPAEAGPASDDPWIETLRCTSCNECKQINDRMFAYDADQRAYIADPDAGSYRELVEAAESCQVAIIHPGKPRNPDEPGLDELLKRAEPFL